MDAYLSCPETRKLIWLGKPIRTSSDQVVFYSQNADNWNHDNPLLNKVVWKFLADHAHKELRVVFSGEFNEDEYDQIGSQDIETEEYIKEWPPKSVL